MRYILLFILLCLEISDVHADYFKHLGMSDGLSHLSVRAFCQDKLGRIWIGTHEGISVFDGRNVLSYKPLWGEGLPPSGNHGERKICLGNLVSCIVGDSCGDMFMLVDGKVVRYDFEKEAFSLVFEAEVHSLCSYEGTVWCARNDSVFRYDRRETGFTFFLKTELRDIQSLLVDNDTFFVGTANGLYKCSGDGRKNELLKNCDVRSLFLDRDRNVWVGTLGDGCFFISSGSSQVTGKVDLLLPSLKKRAGM